MSSRSLVPASIRERYGEPDPDVTGRIELLRGPVARALNELREAARALGVEHVQIQRAFGALAEDRVSVARRALLVEDDPSQQKVYKRYLIGIGFVAVHVAGSFKEGRRRVQNHEYDIIVIDVVLGENGNGIELAHVIRDSSMRPLVPILLISGELTPDDLEYWATVGGASATLLKPFSPDEFSASVRDLLPPPRKKVHLKPRR